MKGKEKKLDRKNCMILELLQKNCRMSLTRIAREIGLSIDSTKKRIKSMLDNGIFHPKVQLRPRRFGFSIVVDVKIRIQNASEDEIKYFISYLREHPRVVELFTVSGKYDITVVMIARDAIDLGKITVTIRKRFGKIIAEWNESITVKCHKFESYKMLQLFNY